MDALEQRATPTTAANAGGVADGVTACADLPVARAAGDSPVGTVATYVRTRRLFLQLLALIYLFAFWSLGIQIIGLVGEHGISPAKSFLDAVAQHYGADRYHLLPTLCWLHCSDAFLRFLCGAGAALALLLLIGVAPAACLALLWMLYLSLTSIGGEFLRFQWDALLLETGFLAIVFAPLTLWPRRSADAPPSKIVLWLLRWLLFRLMFESGLVKLLSGDATWRDLTALTFHYETQPLPTPLGWYAHQLPKTFQHASCVIMFVIELGAPWLFVLGRRARRIAFVAFITLQLLIAATGNYGFFNLLAMALCVLLLDDATLTRWRLRGAPKPRPNLPSVRSKNWPRWITVPLACLIAMVSLDHALMRFVPGMGELPIIRPLSHWLAPFDSINHYGLFAVMTTSRPEIIVEGSDDGREWRAYGFKHKPGDTDRPPGWVAPHMPRLDWQMWFAALGSHRQNMWFIRFCDRLLEGSPDVLALLESNPFPQRPPTYIRAVVYDYHFTDMPTRRTTAAAWRRELKGLYCPVLSNKR